MPKPPVVLIIPTDITIKTVVGTTAIDLDIDGTLVYVHQGLSSSEGKSAADLFTQFSIKYKTQKATVVLITGYASAAQGDGAGFFPYWRGRLPVSTDSQMIIGQLNASGETQRLLTVVVIERE